MVVEVVGYARATIGGRFTTVYQVVWPDGRYEAVPADTFHKQFERERKSDE